MDIEEKKTPGIDESALFKPAPITNALTQDDITKEILGDTVTKPDDKSQQQQQPQDDLPWHLKQLQEINGPEYKIDPVLISGKKEDGTILSDKERWEMFVNEAKIKPADDMISDDPFIARYQIAKSNPEFKPTNFIAEEYRRREVLSLPNKEFLKQIYLSTSLKSETNPDGYTEQEINTYIDGLNAVEIEEKGKTAKQNYINYLVESDQKELAESLKKRQAIFETEEATNQEFIKQHIKKIETTNAFNGLTFGEAIKKEFLTDLPEMIKRDPQTNLNAFEEYMLSNENFLEALPVLWALKKGKLAALVTDLKEEVKRQTELKLNPDSKLNNGITDNGIDEDRLYGRK